MMIFVCILWQRVVYNDMCILHLSVASVEIFAMKLKEVASIGEKFLERRFLYLLFLYVKMYFFNRCYDYLDRFKEA